jgi:hypothetical protein
MKVKLFEIALFYNCSLNDNQVQGCCILGAIRFGEQLKSSQCKKLVRQLANCQLPFQCAHGRPTIQPLGNISCLMGTAPSKGEEAVVI